MKFALKGRPVLNWTMPPGLTMESFGTADGTATDAFKTGQTPGSVVAGEGGPAGPAPAARPALRPRAPTPVPISTPA